MSDVVELRKDAEIETALRQLIRATEDQFGGPISLEDERLMPYIPGLKASIKGFLKASVSIDGPDMMVAPVLEALKEYQSQVLRNMVWSALMEAGILEEIE